MRSEAQSDPSPFCMTEPGTHQHSACVTVLIVFQESSAPKILPFISADQEQGLFPR